MRLFTIMLPLFLLQPPLQNTAPGMTYFIHPDKPTPCKDEFAEGLSTFFEEVGGYGEKAEFVQVCLILRIDLSLFEDVAYDPKDRQEAKRHWHSLDSTIEVVDMFITSIRRNPNYYKKVKYNPNVDKMARELSATAGTPDTAGTPNSAIPPDTAKLWRLLQQYQKDPLFGYPPDNGYLREGRLLKDLQALKATLACYKKHGVTRVRLEYM